MLLRDHPLMSYRGTRNWPPVWTWIGGENKQHPVGEVGILRTVDLSKIHAGNRCFLQIDHEGASYRACLLFDDAAFCIQIADLLSEQCNRSIAEHRRASTSAPSRGKPSMPCPK